MQSADRACVVDQARVWMDDHLSLWIGGCRSRSGVAWSEKREEKEDEAEESEEGKIDFSAVSTVPQLVGYIILVPTVSCSKYPHNYSAHKQKPVFIVSSSKYHIIKCSLANFT